MTRRELALLNTARSTRFCLERNVEHWQDIPGFAEQGEEIRLRVEELDRLAGHEESDRTGLGLQRQKALQSPVDETWIVAGHVRAWASVNGEEEIRQKVCVTKNELLRLQDRLPERALEIHQLGVECLREGGNRFGLTRERLQELDCQIQALKVLRRARPGESFESPIPDGDLVGGLGQVMDLLSEVADPLMRRFQIEEPEFFEEYQIARRVIDPETGRFLSAEEENAWMEEDFTGIGDPLEKSTGRATDSPARVPSSEAPERRSDGEVALDS